MQTSRCAGLAASQHRVPQAPHAVPPHGNTPLGPSTTLHPPVLLGVTVALGAGMEPDPTAAGTRPVPVTPPNAARIRGQDSLVNADFNFQLIVQLWKLDQQPAKSQQTQSVSMNNLHTRTPVQHSIWHRLQNSWMDSSIVCIPQQAAPRSTPQSSRGRSTTQLLQHPSARPHAGL